MNVLNKLDWKSFWSQQSSPLHREATDNYYRNYAKELQLLLSEESATSILDLGCGDGALYEHLGFLEARYIGVDFSSSMLRKFKQNYPNVQLIEGDASVVNIPDKFDLIFLNGVVQYFDTEMLTRCLSNAKEMLLPAGRVVLASVPWSALRFEHSQGGEIVGASSRPPFLSSLRYYVTSKLTNRGMGHWYSLNSIADLAARLELNVKFYGSMHYMYRFHAVLDRSS